MISKFIFDYIERYSEKEQLFLFLTHLKTGVELRYHIEPAVIFKLIEDGIIEKDYITQSFRLLVPFYTSDDGDTPSLDSYQSAVTTVNERLPEYRKLFKGIRIGAMGNPEECRIRLIDFMIRTKVSFDKILEATTYYIENENPQYYMNADNFISNERGSKLLNVLEELPENTRFI